ncbi:hypothetical protein L2E82_18139 [Cichorium intybus]|uniref:Uncharacterized protein n=1 Tax=Cichorium intybus TaxID=13427 RepID=A0ACB9F8W5_CICIN|nr:hypothetical protein L2E82_18139 [Cichorium intybus]
MNLKPLEDSCVFEDVFVSIPRGGPIYIADVVGPLTSVSHFQSCIEDDLKDVKKELCLELTKQHRHEISYSFGVLDDDAKVTSPVGFQIAELPLDPMISKMIIASDQLGCSEEIITLSQSIWISVKAQRELDDAKLRFAASEKLYNVRRAVQLDHPDDLDVVVRDEQGVRRVKGIIQKLYDVRRVVQLDHPDDLDVVVRDEQGVWRVKGIIQKLYDVRRAVQLDHPDDLDVVVRDEQGV